MEKVQFVQIVAGVSAIVGIMVFGLVRAYIASKRVH